MDPLEIFGWLVLAGAVATLVFGILMFAEEDFVYFFLGSGALTFIGFFVYLLIWIVAKALGVI